jgi:hypothetical protein
VTPCTERNSAAFRGDYDAIEILKWKDIVQGFESAANAIENVSDVVESILVKES